jgi:hypothetical protein
MALEYAHDQSRLIAAARSLASEIIPSIAFEPFRGIILLFYGICIVQARLSV